MKYLVLLVVVGVGLWLWRSGRAQSRVQRPPASSPQQAQAMIECGLCHVHVPQADAVSGARGQYCSIEHRQQAES